MQKISNIDVKGKVVVIRVDINLPVKDKKIIMNKRIKEHAKTLKELSEKGAKLVVLGHQGKKGRDDFIGLDLHAKLLEEIIGKEIKFMGLSNWEHIEKEVKELKEGEILLLENIRFMEEETENPFGAKFIEYLSTLGDYFVLDALSVAHREHASIVGLTKKLKSFMGNVLEREVNALNELEGSQKVVFVIGGAKVKDSVGIMRHWLNSDRVEKVLIGGAPVTLFLKAKLGIDMGKENEEYLGRIEGEVYLSEVKEMLEKFGDKIEIPEDVVIESGYDAIAVNIDFDNSKNNEFKGAIKDIGPKTVERYEKIIENAKTIVMNGPMGVYEDEKFENGTRGILNAVVKSKAYSLIGGGHTTGAIDKFGIREDNFSYVSLSGKAFLQYLSGKELPGLVALRNK